MIQPARRLPTGPWLLVGALGLLTACAAHSSAVAPATPSSSISPAAAAPPTALSPTPVTRTGRATGAISTPTDIAPTITDDTTAAVATSAAPPGASATAPPSTPLAAETVPATTSGPAVKSGANVNAGTVVGDPISISIPSIGVESLLVPTGVLADGTMAVPTDASIAGWFTGGPRPGDRGPAVIMGHLDQKSTGPGVFWRLRDLPVGAEATIHTTTGDVVFVATESDLIAKDEFPMARVYGSVPTPALRLITCGGSFDRKSGHYRSNVVVYLVSKVAP